jgi:hypothetical protein
MTRTILGMACATVGMAVGQVTVTGQGGSDLTKLTVPASQLPAACRLIPGPRGFLKTNPAVITDPEQLGFVHSLLFGGSKSVVTDDMRARGAHVAVGYAAAYEEKDGAHEIGVYALRLKDPAAAKKVRHHRGSESRAARHERVGGNLFLGGCASRPQGFRLFRRDQATYREC